VTRSFRHRRSGIRKRVWSFVQTFYSNNNNKASRAALAKELFQERNGTCDVVVFTQTKLLLILVGDRNLAIDVYKYLML